MSVFKRGKIFHYEFWIDGFRYRGSTKQTTKGKAEQFEALQMLKVQEQGSGQWRKPPVLREFSQRFLEFIWKQMDARNLDQDTYKDYCNGWRLLSGTPLAGMRIDRIGTSDAATVQFPGGASTANSALRTLSRMLNLAAEWGYLRTAPRVKLPKVPGRSGLIEPHIEEKLLEHMARDCADVMQIMLDCGMRPEEVLRLEWANVFWERSAVRVPDGKTASAARYVPLPERMCEILQRRKAEQSTSRLKAIRESLYVFPGKGGVGHRKTVRHQWITARAAAGVRPDLVLYCARHTFATNFLSEGGDIAKLSKVMGHTSLSTTQKYLHPSIEGAAELINRRNRRGLQLVKRA